MALWNVFKKAVLWFSIASWTDLLIASTKKCLSSASSVSDYPCIKTLSSGYFWTTLLSRVLVYDNKHLFWNSSIALPMTSLSSSGKSLSIEYHRQSSEGYLTKVDWSAEMRVIENKKAIETHKLDRFRSLVWRNTLLLWSVGLYWLSYNITCVWRGSLPALYSPGARLQLS